MCELNSRSQFSNIKVYLNLQSFFSLHSLVNSFCPPPFLFNSASQLQKSINNLKLCFHLKYLVWIFFWNGRCVRDRCSMYSYRSSSSCTVRSFRWTTGSLILLINFFLYYKKLHNHCHSQFRCYVGKF